jgi:hypothetical protein
MIEDKARKLSESQTIKGLGISKKVYVAKGVFK